MLFLFVFANSPFCDFNLFDVFRFEQAELFVVRRRFVELLSFGVHPNLGEQYVVLGFGAKSDVIPKVSVFGARILSNPRKRKRV